MYILMSYSKSETSITYMTKFQGIFISQKMTLSPGDDDKQGPLTNLPIYLYDSGMGNFHKLEKIGDSIPIL